MPVAYGIPQLPITKRRATSKKFHGTPNYIEKHTHTHAHTLIIELSTSVHWATAVSATETIYL